MRRILLMSLVLVAIACSTAQARPEPAPPLTVPPAAAPDTALNKCITVLAWLAAHHAHYKTASESKGSTSSIKPSLSTWGPKASAIIDAACLPVFDQETLDALRAGNSYPFG